MSCQAMAAHTCQGSGLRDRRGVSRFHPRRARQLLGILRFPFLAKRGSECIRPASNFSPESGW
eukprot:14901409-Heterocapsa_arctica.AAC.1